MKKRKYFYKLLICLSLLLTLVSLFDYRDSFYPTEKDEAYHIKSIDLDPIDHQVIVQRSSFFSPEFFAFLALLSGTIKMNYEFGGWVAQQLQDKEIVTSVSYQVSSSWWRLWLTGTFGWPFAMGFHHEMIVTQGGE